MTARQYPRRMLQRFPPEPKWPGAGTSGPEGASTGGAFHAGRALRVTLAVLTLEMPCATGGHGRFSRPPGAPP
jgi:hypothetical protein